MHNLSQFKRFYDNTKTLTPLLRLRTSDTQNRWREWFMSEKKNSQLELRLWMSAFIASKCVAAAAWSFYERYVPLKNFSTHFFCKFSIFFVNFLLSHLPPPSHTIYRRRSLDVRTPRNVTGPQLLTFLDIKFMRCCLPYGCFHVE